MRTATAAAISCDEYVHKTTSEPKSHALFMHGILGNKRNWRTPGKLLAKANEMRVIAIDHRGHGGSHGLSGSNTVKSCANDVRRVINSVSEQSVRTKIVSQSSSSKQPIDFLSGHSFGGKVALTYLQERYDNNEELPQDTWILDCLPGLFDNTSPTEKGSSESVQGIFDILNDLPKVFEHPNDIAKILVNKGVSLPVAQWLTSNCRHLIEEDPSSSYQLGFDLHSCTELFNDFCQTDMWDFLERFDGIGRAKNNSNANIHFVRAGRNPLWQPHIVNRMNQIQDKNSGITLHTMSHVGHWLHVEDVRGMISLMQDHSKCLQNK